MKIKKKSAKSSFSENFLIAGISGSISKTIAAPIERTRIILQTQDAIESIIEGKKRYKGIFGTISRIVREEGVVGLWRGNLANVMRYFSTVSFNFAFNDHFQKIFMKKNMDMEKHILEYTIRMMAAGGAAGGLSLAINYPFEFI